MYNFSEWLLEAGGEHVGGKVRLEVEIYPRVLVCA